MIRCCTRCDTRHKLSDRTSDASSLSMSGTKTELKRIAVFCGANAGTRPEYLQSAKDVGEELVKRNIGLVYGGGSVGMMGAVAQTVDSGLGKGSVIGVIPHDLMPREMSGAAIGELRPVNTMHQRKAQMADLADAFIAIPGGFGTLEELLEVVTWNQIGFMVKPVGVLNVCGYFDHLLKFFDHAVQEGFVRESSRTIVIEGTTAAELIDKLATYQAPPTLLELAKKTPDGLR